MKCLICGKEFEKKWGRSKFCSPECYHGYRKTWKAHYSHEKYLARKKKKCACIMCGELTVNTKHTICTACKKSEEYQSYGYGQPCSVHC